MKNQTMTRLVFFTALYLFCPWASAGDTGVEETGAEETVTEETETEIVIGGAEATGEEPALTEEESELCANTVVGEIVEGKLAEEIPALARELAIALRDRCQCDAVAVRTMTEAGVPFDESFNTITEVCELDGTELGELSRELEPGLGDATRGPGGEVSP